MRTRESEDLFPSFLIYVVPACLALMAYTYLLLRHKLKHKQPQNSMLPMTRNQLVEYKRQEEEKLSAIQSSFVEAKNIFSSEFRKPWSESKLGDRFGLFSFVRHYKMSNKALETEKKLPLCETNEKAKDEIINLLIAKGSLWDRYSGSTHSFNNYFLTCLRYQNIDAYREIVGHAYGIQFVVGEMTLYRRDTRSKQIIFRDGFELKPESNYASTRKICYAEPSTYSYGISFSKQIPPSAYSYGTGNCYVVVLPPNHKFLLVDIVRSPRNKGRLSHYQLSLEEVNSLDDIPAVNVKARGSTFFYSNTISSRKVNKNFAPIEMPLEKTRANKGCY